MLSNIVKLPTITIASGQTISNIVSGVQQYEDAFGIILYSPTTLPESVYFECNPNHDALTGDSGWVEYETFDVTGTSIRLFVPGANKCQVYQEPMFAGAFRLRSTTNVAADRVFAVTKLFSLH